MDDKEWRDFEKWHAEKYSKSPSRAVVVAVCAFVLIVPVVIFWLSLVTDGSDPAQEARPLKAERENRELACQIKTPFKHGHYSTFVLHPPRGIMHA